MPVSNDQSVFPDYVRVKDVDQSRLADLTLQAKGDRSLSDFARLCNVNPSTLSRLVNQKNNGPCSDSLIKAIAENAAPDSGVTLEMLLDAQGLAPYTNAPRVPEGASSFLKQFQKAVDNIPNSSAIDAAQEALRKYTESVDAAKLANQAQSELQNCQKQLGHYREELDVYQRQVVSYKNEMQQLTQKLFEAEKKIASDEKKVANAEKVSAGVIKKAPDGEKEKEFARDAQEIVVNALFDAGFLVKPEKPDGEMSKHGYFDFGLSTEALEERNIKRWYFEVKQGVYSTGMRFLDELFKELYFESTYDAGTAVSLIISDQSAFEKIKRTYGNREIHDYVSVILLDRSKRKIVDEFIFAQRGQDPHRSIFK